MSTLDFSRRSTLDELMDTEPVGFEEFRACLVDLARVNRLTLAYRPTFSFLERLVARGLRGLSENRPLEVIDVGSGYGDMLRRIDAWARERGIAVSLTGVDLNPLSRRSATEATPPGRPITWVTADAFAYEPPGGIDVVLSSLFTHHLPDPAVVRFLAWMEAKARLGWFINDLHRHPLPYHFFRHLSRLAGWHRFVQHDGPVSIARAFSASDWRCLIAEAGLDPRAVEVRWWMPFRLTVGRLKVP
ncbi:methyltransferase domain-containing protein [Sorangium sp. So ce1000]|uniref:methyltransferase domain-containing protein n=1 Tax=Sorangium sp. So ce1000 TaxID=3133325 RepID=UPI003F603B85